MATRRISALILQKSSVSVRWLCTVKETTKTVKEKKNLLFNRVSRLTPFSKTSANDVLDKWVEEGNPVKRFDLVNLIGYCRNRKKFHLALQVIFSRFQSMKLQCFVLIWLDKSMALAYVWGWYMGLSVKGWCRIPQVFKFHSEKFMGLTKWL